MNFPDALFPQAWALGAWLPLIAARPWCLRTTAGQRLTDSSQLNVWLGGVVLLILVWSMKAGVKPGLDLHLLGATLFTLLITVMLVYLPHWVGSFDDRRYLSCTNNPRSSS
ncbi:MAG: energy-coupling factor ABC transporter permease [Rhodocyclales bacterium]|nr:energy-coupling factor ABC transporter permease [Rhodocyclales bacterium]